MPCCSYQGVAVAVAVALVDGILLLKQSKACAGDPGSRSWFPILVPDPGTHVRGMSWEPTQSRLDLSHLQSYYAW